MNWKQAEIMGYAYYIGKDYRILIPTVCLCEYDFVAEKGGEFLRVNVKVAGLKDKSQENSWSISQSSGGHDGHHERNEIDIYLVWLPHRERFIEIDGQFLTGGNSKSRRIPKKFLI